MELIKSMAEKRPKYLKLVKNCANLEHFGSQMEWGTSPDTCLLRFLNITCFPSDSDTELSLVVFGIKLHKAQSGIKENCFDFFAMKREALPLNLFFANFYVLR